MKIRNILTILSLFTVSLGFSQSVNQNYTIEKIYKDGLVPGSSGSPINNFVTVTYYDGLGRPIQQVQQNASPIDNKNIVTHIEYDKNIGQTKEYLPFTVTGSNANYLNNAKQATLDYYTTYNEYTENPYSEKRYEAAPNGRVTEIGAPGYDWNISVYEGYGVPEDDRNTIRYKYDFNKTNEVKKYVVNTEWNNLRGLFTSSIAENGFYQVNSLSKTIIKNENWKPADGLNNTTEEFRGTDGKVVLKRTYNAGVAHDTYYAYDFYGNLAYVIPPLANGSVIGTNLNDLCYQYLYDERNRLVEKKLPQKDWEYIVYDKMDRIVMTGPVYNPFGDGSKGWFITKYDVFGRSIYTGYYAGSTFSSAERNSLAQNNFTIESKSAGNTAIDGVVTSYTNTSFPTGFNLLSVNYYDDYSFPGAPTSFPSVENQAVNTAVKGQLTGSWLRVLAAGSNAGITSYNLYDNKYRIIRSYNENHLSGYMQVDSQLRFTGVPAKTVTYQKQNNSTAVLTITDVYTYDQRDRLTKQTRQIGTGSVETIVLNTYDELGVLTTKKVGGATGNLQIVNYKYNIRGWLTNINDTQFDVENDLFNFKINYVGSAGEGRYLYNGNIHDVISRTKTDNLLRGYAYYYDDLNRLVQAKGLYYKTGGWNIGINKDDSYGEALSYDKNGNILTLNRTGELVSGQPIQIDDLTYTYTANQLQTVTDATNNNDGFKDGNKVGNDYTYDTFGNITQDKNKGITAISYNHLNLPVEIVFANGGKITYYYDALGTRLRKAVQPNGGTLTNTDYVNGFQYLNGVLQFFPHAEGYVKRNTNNTYLYVYQYKDHLGNIRLSYADCDGNGTINPATEILEENNYYPFGLQHKGYNEVVNSNRSEAAEKYKYNGKEYEDAFGLNMYEYGARNYDPAVGRFFNIDRLSEKYESLSPYNYTANNPVRFIDVDGEWIDIYENGNQYRYIMGGGVQQLDKKSGKWNEVEDTTSLSFYVQEVICNLYELETSGSTGAGVVSYFNNDNRQADFRGYDSETKASINSISNRVYIKEGFMSDDIMTVDGLKEARMFLLIGHELAHIIDSYENSKQYKDEWFKTSTGKVKTRSEIFATHVENQIRAQSGYPLRSYYGIAKDENNRQFGLRGTLLLDGNNNSLYFKQTQPGVFDIQNRGEIINQKIQQIKNKNERYRY